MRWLHVLGATLAGLFRRRRLDDQLDRDLQFHLEQDTLEYIRRGLSPDEARREARRAFGGVESAKTAVRSQRRRPFERTVEDLTYSWRRLRRAPGFTIVAVLTLALGIGANTSLFSLANGLLFRSLPIPAIDRLAVVGTTRAGSTWLAGLTDDDARLVEQTAQPLIRRVFTSDPLMGALSVDGRAEFVVGELVSGHYFSALGIAPLAGRVLIPADDDAASPLAIVISEKLWRRWFNADPSAIGATARMAGRTLTIAGVAPGSFTGTWLPTMLSADFWVPIRAEDQLRTVQGGNAVTTHRTFVELGPGVSLERLDAAVRVLDARQAPDRDDGHLTVLPAVRGMLFDEFAKPGRLMATAVVSLASLVFLIACANLANLVLARVAGRSGEIAIRLATGADRLRVFRLVLTEVVLLTALAGAAGVGVTVLTTRVMANVPLPTLDGVRIQFNPAPDWRVFAFAFVVAGVAALAVGIVPAWRAAHVQPLRVMASGGAAPGVTARRHWLRSMLVATQMMASVVLLLAAGVYARSALRAARFDPGFDISSTAMASVNMSLHRIEEARGRQAATRILEGARRIPGVLGATLTSGLAGVGGTPFLWVAPADASLTVASIQTSSTTIVTPDFFTTLRIPVRRGRVFTEADVVGSQNVAIVSESLAERLWPAQDPIGRRMTQVNVRPVAMGGSPGSVTFGGGTRVRVGPELEVVGVVADTESTIGRDEFRHAAYYRPMAQEYSPRFSVVVRGADEPQRLVEPLAQAIRAADSDLAPMDARTVADSVGVLLTPIRITAVVLGALGLLGFSIAALGLYGVLAYLVTERRREFGIRMALGATASQIRTGVIRAGARMMLAGAIPGVALAFVGAGALGRLLYQVSPRDPITFAGVPLALFVVGLVAAWFAGRRVSSIDPNVALRDL